MQKLLLNELFNKITSAGKPRRSSRQFKTALRMYKNEISKNYKSVRQYNQYNR